MTERGGEICKIAIEVKSVVGDADGEPDCDPGGRTRVGRLVLNYSRGHSTNAYFRERASPNHFLVELLLTSKSS